MSEGNLPLDPPCTLVLGLRVYWLREKSLSDCTYHGWPPLAMLLLQVLGGRPLVMLSLPALVSRPLLAMLPALDGRPPLAVLSLPALVGRLPVLAAISEGGREL